jgi:phosphoserine phosphatase RsbU/P
MSQQTSIPQLFEVSKAPVSVAGAMQVNELLALFQQDPELLTVAIADNGAFLGSVNRKDLLNLLSRKFAMDLYAKKSILTLLKDLGGREVVFPAELDINQAAVQLLSLDPTLQTDAFPVLNGKECVGVVAVCDLMLAVAEQQRGLLETLDRLSSRIREEVAHGVKIQQDLLPPPLYRFKGVTVGAGVTTCSEIGGDFFDYFSIGEDTLGLVIADVSGHGVQAGMVTTAAKASLHTLIALGVTTPAGLLAGMNNAILTTARQSLLMTCLIASLDLCAGTITIANAGHNFPFLLRAAAGRAEMLETTAGFPLGFERDSAYPESRCLFSPGDALFLYTDGLVECAGPGGEELGYGRLGDLLDRCRDLPPQSLHASLLGGAAAFAGTDLFTDDVTTLMARFDTARSA